MQYCGYIKLATLEYPRYMFDILYEHPEIQYSSPEYGEFPHPSTYAIVRVAAQPEHNVDTHVAEQGTPTQIDGEWYQSWTVRALTDQEITDRNLIREQVAAQIAESASMNQQAGNDAPSNTVTFIQPCANALAHTVTAVGASWGRSQEWLLCT